MLLTEWLGTRAQIIGNESDTVQFTKEAMAYYRLNIGAAGNTCRLRRWHGCEQSLIWEKWGTMRWSAPNAQLVLPVIPGEAYEVTLDVLVPKWAVEPGAGLYHAGKRVVAFGKEGVAVLRGKQLSPQLSTRTRGKIMEPARAPKEPSHAPAARSYRAGFPERFRPRPCPASMG